MNWILVTAFLGCIVSSQGALPDVLGICCDMGRKYAQQDGGCNDMQFFPFFTLEQADRPACASISSACCDHEVPRLSCDAGMKYRADVGSCKDIERDECTSTKNDCCNCCELGMKTYFDGGPCVMETLGEMCNLAFTTCCNRSFNEGDVDECSIPVEVGRGGVSAFNGRGGRRCQEQCVNIIGDYACECEDGKVIADDGWTCVPDDPGTFPTSRPYRNPCDTAPCAQYCQSNSVTYQCSCRPGYRLNNDGATCSPDDNGGPTYNLCESAHCNQECESNGATYQCICRQGFRLESDGYTCTVDFPADLCATSPCTQDCSSSGNTYECYCRQGYRLENDGSTCIVDRPADLCATADCTQDCQSNGATYQCYCRRGYRLDSDGFTCIDDSPVDLCATTAPCTQECQSNSATYRCFCRQGYRLEGDGYTCTADRPADPCATAPCTQECQRNRATYQCSCRQGYRLEGDGYTCTADRPADLCATAPCTQDCQSNSATYQCSCRQGYQLESNGYSCRAINRPPSGDLCDTAPCQHSCNSNSVTYSCRCNQGFLLMDDLSSCQDENECETGYYQCRAGEQCVNTEGAYRCDAGEQCTEPGYAYNEISGRCEDIDECETDPEVCELYQECINYDGHYYCNTLCGQGYQVIKDEQNRRHTCQDVDECSLSLHNCAISQRCDNLPGRFQCTRTTPCGTGYTINGASQECEDVDECRLNIHDCDAYYMCNNTHGSFRCEPCPSGFRVTPSINVCNVDINECNDPNICEGGSRCENTYGSYKCASLCGEGFEFNAYQRRCMDIDECARGSHTCGANQLCKNTINGFSCGCKEGFNYNFDTQTCYDMDECAEGDRIGRPKCRAHERCENVPGSHRCTPACSFGQKFQLHGNMWNCSDVNECLLGTHNCRSDEICVNDAYNGTFRCIRCTRGTVFNARAKTCDDIDECKNPTGRVCLGICNNNPGSFYCTCPTGYNMIQSRVCRDIDECQVGTHRCRSGRGGDLCFNTKGSHKCMNIECPPHYDKRVTGRQMRCDKIQRGLCPQPPAQDIHNCAGNRTSPIIYFPLALRSYADLPSPQDVLTLRIPAPSDIINFSLDYGNERGYFAVEKRQSGQTEGVLRLVQAIEGPYQTEVHMAIRTDISSVYERPNWVETSKAIILVDVSPFDF